MENLIISGGIRLEGKTRLQGSKNSSLPILAACAAVNGISVIHNCPRITDVDIAVAILERLVRAARSRSIRAISIAQPYPRS